MSGDSKVKDPEYLRRRRRSDNSGEAASETADGAQPHADTRSEMEDLQHNLGNQAVTQLVRSGAVQRQQGGQQLRARDVIAKQVQRQKKPAAKPMDEAQARTELTTHWGVSRIDAGTAAEQEQQMLTLHSAYFPNMTPPGNLGTLLTNAGWASWKPPSSSPVWDGIVKAFEGLGKAFGGVPPVKQILFFKTSYTYVPTGPNAPLLKPNNSELAYYSAGSYVVFEAVTYQGTVMPTATGKSVAGSAVPQGSRPVELTLTHELGHGIVEAVLNNIDKDMIDKFSAAVGWFGGRLYDGGVQDVKDAIKNGNAPDPRYAITPDKWADSQWKEQPYSRYSVEGGPSEDFPESVAAYVRDPATLKARSPARYDFVAAVAAKVMGMGASGPLRART